MVKDSGSALGTVKDLVKELDSGWGWVMDLVRASD